MKLNITITPELAKSLSLFMKKRHLRTRAEALVSAAKETLEKTAKKQSKFSFKSWIGTAKKTTENPHARWKTDADLWK